MMVVFSRLRSQNRTALSLLRQSCDQNILFYRPLAHPLFDPRETPIIHAAILLSILSVLAQLSRMC